VARDAPPEPQRRPDGVGFLLAQVGGHAARRFAARVSTLDLTPPQAGLLRAIARQPGQTQQSYAAHLGVPPSRFVTLVDSLEGRGSIERRRRPDDRRAYGLHLTADGEALMRDIGRVSRAHEDDLCQGLTDSERNTLRELLARIADAQGLTPGVHPGYRDLQ
jgi:DNA-binding MarR family transcriptional regulator